MAPLKIIFMGSPDFAVPSLTALAEAGHEIVRVYAQPPRPAGRGQRRRPCPVHAYADDAGYSVRTPVSLRDDAEQAAFRALEADAAVVAAYGLILPPPVLEGTRLGCFNVHASLLPRWRGAAPIHRALLAGDEVSGVTIMAMDEGLDTGGVLLRGETPITQSTTAQDLHDCLAEIGAELIVEALAGVAAGTLTATPQPADGVTYADKLVRDEGRLDWRLSAVELERRVRALNPWPGTWFEHAGERIRVLGAEARADTGAPGTVLDDALLVACGGGALAVTRAQRPGKGPMDTAAFLRGYAIAPGTQLD